jgi:hypothetical protein
MIMLVLLAVAALLTAFVVAIRPSMTTFTAERPGGVLLAVGGVYPGRPDDKTEFPATFLIDYVRITAA